MTPTRSARAVRMKAERATGISLARTANLANPVLKEVGNIIWGRRADDAASESCWPSTDA